MSEPDRIIQSAVSGNQQATRELFHLVYDDLRRVAAARLAGEAPGQTLTATALVHEAFLKLAPESKWNDSAHLYRTAARAIRQILIDAGRRKRTLKRGDNLQRVQAADMEIQNRTPVLDPLELHDSLEALESVCPEAAAVFDLRFYAGLTWENIAETLGISVEKADSLWSYARARLAKGLTPPR